MPPRPAFPTARRCCRRPRSPTWWPASTASSATMIALREIEVKGGKGQVIDLSLLEPIHSVIGADAAMFKAAGMIPKRQGSRSNITSPRNVYQTRDGRWISISASMQSMAERLYAAVGVPEMIKDPRFADNSARLAHAEEAERPIGRVHRPARLRRMPGHLRGCRGDGRADLRHRPVRRRSARAGARRSWSTCPTRRSAASPCTTSFRDCRRRPARCARRRAKLGAAHGARCSRARRSATPNSPRFAPKGLC